jgi:organic radical activating enzyme
MTDFTDIPFERIVKFGQATMLDSNLFSISWILGRFCNYSCSYCWPYANSQTPDYKEFEVYTRAIDSIKKQARHNGFTKFHWSLSGGEPTAYKQLNELVAHLGVEDYQSIHMTTNLSPGIKWWERWLENTKYMQRRSITASFHHEFADEVEFGDKILFLMNNQVFVTINQVMVPEQFEQLYDRCKRFNDRGINVTLKPQSDPTASRVVDGYTDDMLYRMRTGFPQQLNQQDLYQVKLIDDTNKVWYLDQAERFNSFGFNNFKGWMCNSGYQGIVIRENEVKRSYSCMDQPIGTLDNFTIFTEPKVCISTACVSSADSKLPKVKCIN